MALAPAMVGVETMKILRRAKDDAYPQDAARCPLPQDSECVESEPGQMPGDGRFPKSDTTAMHQRRSAK